MSDIPGAFIAAEVRERELRHRRLMMARISSPRIIDQDIVIRNISQRGLGAATQGIFPALGEQLVVKLPDGQALTGIVRWADGPSFGLALDIELNPEDLADVKSKALVKGSAPTWEVSHLHRVAPPIFEPGKLRRV